jgi:uncharacterized protein YdaU (DUF1376 family)
MTNKTDIWMPLYVADYLSSTTRLTTEQHGAYLLLIIDYWKSGRLPDDDSILANVTRLSMDAWAKHRGVLQGFFEVSNGEWIHSRIEKEIEKSGDLKLAQIKKSILGNYVKYGKIDQRVETDLVLKEWWAIESLRHSPKDSPKAPPSPSPSPTHLSKDKKNTATKVACPSDVGEQVWDDWLALRKAKKAPVTETALKSARKEAEKAGISLNAFLTIWCARGSQGLEASWLKSDEKQMQTETVYQRSMRLKMEEAVPSIAKRAPEPYQDASDFFRTIDMPTQKVIEVNK